MEGLCYNKCLSSLGFAWKTDILFKLYSVRTTLQNSIIVGVKNIPAKWVLYKSSPLIFY